MITNAPSSRGSFVQAKDDTPLEAEELRDLRAAMTRHTQRGSVFMNELGPALEKLIYSYTDFRYHSHSNSSRREMTMLFALDLLNITKEFLDSQKTKKRDSMIVQSNGNCCVPQKVDEVKELVEIAMVEVPIH